MSNSFPPEVQSRVDVHLDAVERQLQSAGIDRTKRRGIVDDLETQILDMLGTRESRVPTDADIGDVLSRLDPPEAYATETVWPTDRPLRVSGEEAYEPRLCRQAKLGAWYLGVGVVGQVLFVLGLFAMRQALAWLERSSVPVTWATILLGALVVTTAVVGVGGPILGTGLGWIATDRIRRSGGTQYGLGLAVIESLLYPVLLAWIITSAIRQSIEMGLYGTSFVERERTIWLKVLWVVCASILSFGLAWYLRWSTGPRRTVPSRPNSQNGSTPAMVHSNG